MVVSSLTHPTAPGEGETEAYLSDRVSQSEASEASLPKASNESPAPAAPKSPMDQPDRSQFPPRLSREPRPQNSPYANIDLPPFVAQATRQTRNATSAQPPATSLVQGPEPAAKQADFVTLEMRPARLPVSSFWHRLRFNRFSPMVSQRRSDWKPAKPRRGRPEGTKGAGSRSL